jgi:hypothetical protein
MITLSIDVTKMDKARFKHITRKNGEKAIFAELVLIETPNGEFGDYMVKQSVTKQEREDGVQLPILGNGRDVVPVKRAVEQVRKAVNKPAPAELAQDWQEAEDIPF